MRKRLSLILVLVLLAAGAGGGWWWWQHRSRLPEGIASGNGRIEAETVQIASKTGGRILEMLVREGDLVEPGQVLARIDTDELDAYLEAAQANEAAARDMVAAIQAQILQRQSELKLAGQNLDRVEALVARGNVSRQDVDERRSQMKTAEAALTATQAQLGNAESSVDAARAEIRRIQTLIDDSTLKSPIAGRVQYRLAEPGEVVAAGGRVVTLIDLQNVHMTIFLPTAQIGRTLIGAEARIVLDAVPDYVIPANVSFISAEAQFTPRSVETRTEREKLMFRVKIAIPVDLLRAHEDKVRTGLPGVAYVMLAPPIPWPDSMAVRLPPTP